MVHQSAAVVRYLLLSMGGGWWAYCNVTSVWYTEKAQDKILTEMQMVKIIQYSVQKRGDVEEDNLVTRVGSDDLLRFYFNTYVLFVLFLLNFLPLMLVKQKGTNSDS